MNLIICIRFLLDTLVLYLQGAQKRSGPGKHVFLSFFLSFVEAIDRPHCLQLATVPEEQSPSE